MSGDKKEMTHDEKLAKVRDLIKGIDIGMLTTINEEGHLHSRPMSVNGEVEFDGDLWFFTYGDSTKVHNIEKMPHVNVAFSDPKGQTYVSVCGSASLVRDKGKIEEMWKPELKAWFPDGVDTNDIALLKIESDGVEYWDSPGSAVAHAIGFVKSTVLHQKANVGEDKKLDLK